MKPEITASRALRNTVFSEKAYREPVCRFCSKAKTQFRFSIARLLSRSDLGKISRLVRKGTNGFLDKNLSWHRTYSTKIPPLDWTVRPRATFRFNAHQAFLLYMILLIIARVFFILFYSKGAKVNNLQIIHTILSPLCLRAINCLTFAIPPISSTQHKVRQVWALPPRRKAGSRNLLRLICQSSFSGLPPS